MSHEILQVDEAARWIRDASAIVVLTGAGISTESGIPDFRGPQGLWTKNPETEKLANIEYYVRDPEVRKAAWRNRLSSGMWNAEPNPGHRALADLEKIANLHTLVTQNVDGLHQKAGSSPEKVIEIHGTMRDVVCLDCGWRAAFGAIIPRLEAGEEDPACPECGGIVKSATISFGQNLVVEDLERAQHAALSSDVFLALGTSLTVYPAAALPELALRSGARLVVANQQDTPFDSSAAAVFRDPLGELLPALVARL